MKKIKEFTKRNIKLVIGLIIGTFVSGIGVYASTILFNGNEISFDNSKAKLTLNDKSVTNMQEAMDALYEKASNAGPATCKNSPFKLGDYVQMTPTSSSYPVPTDLRGNATAVTLTPSELKLWRVIRINSDCTVEMVSEYVSSQNVQFKDKAGYQNLVYVLNEIAKQYANTTYTLDPSDANTPDGAFRNVGYDGQTKQISDTTRLDDKTLGTETGAWYQKAPDMLGVEENLGGGDFKFATDLKLMSEAGVSAVAYKYNTTTKTTYWLASRLYSWFSTSNRDFRARYVSIDGTINAASLYSRSSGRWYAYYDSYAVRPVVTLKSGLTTPSGSGTSASPYVLS